eukprot:XP_001196343.2 PREDICTED: NAD-dependent protein deacylase sirtuin-5, mitochondrial [Strongylocentrotus purpuratus]
MLMLISSHAGRTLNHIPRAISGAFRALLNPAVSQRNNFKMATESDQRWNSDVAALREEISKAKHIVFMTGAGASAESGVPTFRGAGGFWRKWQAQQLATPEAFESNPSLVWEFYHYRREVMITKHPNKGHIAIADFEKRLSNQERRVSVITQNIDELHRQAGSANVIEMHVVQKPLHIT